MTFLYWHLCMSYTGEPFSSALPVSGEANFDMERTALTVGGFTQPIVAKALIELPSSVEKGLTQHFLWLSSKPSFSKFDTLEMIDEVFCTFLGELCVCTGLLTCLLRYTVPCIS